MKCIYTLVFLLQLVVSSQAQVIHIAATDTAICDGTPVTFSATSLTTGTPHFQWQINRVPVGADSTGFTTDALNDNDSVRCLLYNPTFDTILAISDTIIMQVHLSPPDACDISGPSKVCVGATVSLNATVAGGTWSTTNGHASVNDGVVKGESAGFFECPYDVLDTVRYTLTNYCGADTTMHEIVIKPLPVAFVDVVFPWSCPFSDFVFTGPRCGYTYIDTLDIGRSCIRGWLYRVSSNECGSDTSRYYQPVSVCDYVKDVPKILSTTDRLCIGTSVSIAPNDNYYRPTWKATNSNVSIADSGGVLYVKPNKTGLDTILLSYTNVCGPSSYYTKYDTLIVSIHSQPFVDSVHDRVCVDGKTQLNAQPAGGTWTAAQPSVAGVDALSGKVAGLSPGIAQFTYTIDGLCSATTYALVEDCPSDAWITPVPVTEELQLHTLDEDAYTHCRILDAVGREMARQLVVGRATVINTGWYASGVYFLHLSGGDKEKVLKFLKQ